MGLLLQTNEKWFQGERDPKTFEVGIHVTATGTAGVKAEKGLTDDQINLLIKERDLARKNEDFGRSDQIRDKLKSEGILLEDNPDGGTTWRRAD